MKGSMKSVIIVLGLLFVCASCDSQVDDSYIQGVWEIDDYLVEDESNANLEVLKEAKALLKDNNNNVMFFSKTKVGAIMPNGDTLTQNDYKISEDKLIIGSDETAISSSFKLKNKNTLHFFDEQEDLVVQFKRVR